MTPPLPPLPLDFLRQQLTTIYVENQQTLTPQIVLDTATDPEHPLHRYFEWNDDSAAHKYRLVQASHLIRRVTVKIESSSGSDDPVEIRAFYPLPGAATGAPSNYHPEAIIRQNSAAQQLVLGQMRRDWMSMRRRWQHLHEFWQLVAAESPPAPTAQDQDQDQDQKAS